MISEIRMNKMGLIINSILFGLIILVSISSGATKTNIPESKIVTLADDGQTITLQVNETFLLKLGEGYDWNITIADQSIVNRVPNVLVVRGAQGIYRANKEGSSTLSAIGDPFCRQARPPCAAPSRMFRINVVVAGAPKTPAFEVQSAILAIMAALIVKRKW
jgi:predicted secreted protein